jgi:predicted DNA-binding protein (UPF0251 family)
MSHRIELTAKEITQIKGMAGLGMTLEAIAPILGVSKSYLYEECKANPAVADAYENGKSTMQLKVAQALVKQALEGNNLSAIIWYEKTRSGKKEPPKISELEAIEVLIQAGILPAQLAQFAASELESIKDTLKNAIAAYSGSQQASIEG